MHSTCRAALAALSLLALVGCFGKPGTSPAAQDAHLIVAAIAPLAQAAAGAGVSPDTLREINESLTIARRESAALDSQVTPNLLDVQQFHLAARDLLQTLGGLSALPAEDQARVAAARQLLPTFDAVDTPTPDSASPRIAQARLLLQGTEIQPAPAPAAPPAVAQVAPPPRPPTGRFHLSADDFAGQVSYQFWDSGQVVEKGTVADLHALDLRFAAFRRSRLQQAP